MPQPTRRTRVDQRTSLFASAVLYSGTTCSPVRVRNISRAGALVEASSLPPTGSVVRLSRADLSVDAKVKWVRAGKAGLRFNSPADVSAWIRSCSVRGHQERVDDVIAVLRADADTAHGKASRPAPPYNADLHYELTGILNALEEVCEKLTLGKLLLKRHPVELQRLDMAMHVLRKIIEKF